MTPRLDPAPNLAANTKRPPVGAGRAPVSQSIGAEALRMAKPDSFHFQQPCAGKARGVLMTRLDRGIATPESRL